MPKIILTTGGTGGHIFPALAVAEELTNRGGHELLFIGSEYGPESRLAAKYNIPFKGLPVRGLLGRGLRAIPAAIHLGLALMQSINIIRDFKPDAVAGFGAYASFAPVLAAGILRKPVLLHEQNSIAGFSNRFLAKFADKICVSLPDTKGFNKPCVVTGNPIRKSISDAHAHRNKAPEEMHLLIVGGSQGAHRLNTFIADNLAKFKEKGVQIRHQCGEKDLPFLQDAYQQSGIDVACVSPFIDDMAEAYAWADLVFCRSGASTVAELCACGAPALFVPFPAAIHDHQTLNARSMVNAGAARLVPENELDNEKTTAMIIAMLRDKSLLQIMSAKARAIAKPHAAKLLADEILALIK